MWRRARRESGLVREPHDAVADVSKRLGSGLEWAVAEAGRLIHDNDTGGLGQLLAEYPALLSWRGDEKMAQWLEETERQRELRR